MEINNTLYYIGEQDNCSLFERIYPVKSMTYNSYLIKDDVNILLDTVDINVSKKFIGNLKNLLGNDNLDYIIVNHTEPDHAYCLKELLKIYPNTTLVINKTAKNFLTNLYDINHENLFIVDETSSLKTKNYDLCFYLAPFVHWPEVMVTYDKNSKILFSADAFGTFGSFDNLYEESDINEYRRYYSNICGKFGVQVNKLLDKLNLEINLVCPLHGPLIKDNINELFNKYRLWSSYTPEVNDTLIIYSSIYDNTKNLCLDINKQIPNSVIYDVTTTHFSYLISEIFKYKNIVVANITYNNGLLPHMELLINEINSHNIVNRNLFLIENGSWAPMANKLVLEKITNNNIISKLTIKGCLKETDNTNLENFINTVKENQ